MKKNLCWIIAAISYDGSSDQWNAVAGSNAYVLKSKAIHLGIDG